MELLHGLQSWFENFQGDPLTHWMVDHVEIPVAVTALYMVMVLRLPDTLMKDRPPYNLKTANILWNLLLTVFSCVGAYYTLPMLYKMVLAESYEVKHRDGGDRTEVMHGSVYNSICNWHPTQFYDGPVGVFVCLFILSKTPEMLDTAFLVFQKKRVIFLHWYHHITVMLYCWHAYVYKISAGLVFAGMNYGVHSIMYFYYLMCALGYRKVVRPFAPLITFLQIAQMVVGTYVTVYTLYHIYISGEGCASHAGNARLGFMMYISYFVLFSKLFKDSYLTKTPASGGNGTAKRSDSKAGKSQ